MGDNGWFGVIDDGIVIEVFIGVVLAVKVYILKNIAHLYTKHVLFETRKCARMRSALRVSYPRPSFR